MVKLAGAAVILWAALLSYGETVRSQRVRWDTLRQLRIALEETASAIRSTRSPLPDALARQADRPYCGDCFRQICRSLERGEPLSEAWASGFNAMPGQEGRILRAVTLQGDEALLLSQLDYAAVQLRHLEEQTQSVDRSRRRIQLCASLCLACLLTIILL